MQQREDITTRKDIEQLVDVFYERVNRDSLLSPVFNAVIRDRWPAHLEKMYRFWETVLLDAHSYTGAPFLPHATLPVHRNHFEAWLGLWHGAVDELFEGERAEEAKWRAGKMATMFHSRIEHYRNSTEKPLR